MNKGSGGKGVGKKRTEMGICWSVFYLSLSSIFTFAVLYVFNRYSSSHASSPQAPKEHTISLPPRVTVSKSDSTRIPSQSRQVELPSVHQEATKLKPPSQPSQPDAPIAKKPDLASQERSATLVREPASSVPSLLGSSIRCDASVAEAYAKVPDSGGPGNLQWCRDMRRSHQVSVGRSWGSLSRGQQQEWDRRRCNELLSQGALLSCADQWGWSWFNTWRSSAYETDATENNNSGGNPKKKKVVLQGQSNVSCIVDYKTTTYCEMRNVAVDFSQMRAAGTSRSFRSGFLTLHGSRGGAQHLLPPYPGVRISDTAAPLECAYREPRTTFVLSNDDIFNLGHYINDVLGIWAMAVLANARFSQALLLNVDGYRAGGPAGGGSHRLMVPQRPDTHGPYSPVYYETWFDLVAAAKDFQEERALPAHSHSNKRRLQGDFDGNSSSSRALGESEQLHAQTCFDRLFVFPLPGVPWFWNDWGRVNECSLQAASPLYQSFNVFLRQRILDTFGADALTPPAADALLVVIEVRRINPNKGGARTATGRFIRNLPQLVAALQAVPGVRVVTQDFAQLPFLQQVQLAHRASVFVSMHGAGTTHIFHMALGSPRCCALLELFPDPSIDLHTAQGYGNLARMLGLHHARLVAPTGASTAQGTAVDVGAAAELLTRLTTQMQTRPTCLHDVKDTRDGIYGPGRAEAW